MKKTSPSLRLGVLTRAALALPAIAQLAQAEMPANTSAIETELSYRYSRYEEESLAAAQVLSGSNERYQVDHQQFRLVTPIADDLSLTVDAAYETMSGASAYGTALDANGEHRLVMSGASIKETRIDVLSSVRKRLDGGAITLSVGHSDEDDYTSNNVAAEAEHYSLDRSTTYSVGLGISQDDIEPVQTVGILRVLSEDRQSLEGFFAIAKVLSPVWQVQIGVFGAWHEGFLADPYKSRDIRPDQRQSVGFSVNSRYFVRAVGAALHTDYRFFHDDWGIEAHTLEAAWHQSVSDQIQLVPRVRYYSQSQADFYVDADSGDRSGYQSSDYRLSPFGALSYGISTVWDQGDYRLTLSAEHYQSDGDLALKSVDVESPALVDYSLLTLGIDYRY